MMNVFLVAGARPNFMKIAPIYRKALAVSGVVCRIVHTGQHYDTQMSQSFFDDLGIPSPTYFLEGGSGSHAVQTAKIMVAFENVCLNDRPDWVMVVGDVNSTLACSIVAKKLGIRVAHVEAGLRSFDMSMPEEINRMVTDAISDLFFVTEASGSDNLLREGKSADKIHFVGNVMIDNLFHQVEQLQFIRIPDHLITLRNVCRAGNGYAFLTLHRPSNVDDKDTFRGIAEALNQLAEEMPILFPVHPRTQKMMDAFDIQFVKNIRLLPPLGFSESLFLWKNARLVLTDSGGLQEESTALGIPCVTIRQNTERPITIEMGTNILAGTTRQGIINAVEQSLAKERKATLPPLWDGKAAERIWNVISKRHSQKQFRNNA